MAALCKCLRMGVLDRKLNIRHGYNFCFTNNRGFSSQSSSEVVIPNYIPRGPTDILRALASTVRRDPTAPHYIYHDDPFLIPSNTLNKRTFVLSKESGKRAARYFLENFPQNFENDDAEPTIPAFNPPTKLSESSYVTTDMLSYFIQSLQVENAYQAYCNLKTSGVTLGHEIKCELLELLCFYNSTEPSDETYRDEKWFEYNQSSRQTNTVWRKNGPAEQVFEDIEVKDAQAYHALIQGLSRYHSIENALKLYSEMKEQGFKGNTKLYNGLIHLMTFQPSNSGSRWTTAMEFMQAMVQEGLEPDLGTFNSLLLSLTRMRGLPQNKNITKSILAEMKAVGIKPSLATFSHVLHVFCYTNNTTTSYILHDIMDVVEKKVWDLRDPNDMLFFPLAMSICNNYLQDVELAHRVHAMFSRNNNERFIEDAQRFSQYYSNYFHVMCSYDEPDRFFAFYDALVPMVYTPEPKVMEDIVESINVSGQLKYLPRLWSDIRVFQMTNRPVLIENILSMVARGLSYQDDAEVRGQLMTVVWDVFDCVEERNNNERTKIKIMWTRAMLADLLTCSLSVEDMEKSWEVVNFLILMKDNVTGELPPEPVLRYCKLELDTGSKEKVMACLRYASNLGMPGLAEFMKENADRLPKEFLDKYLDRSVGLNDL